MASIEQKKRWSECFKCFFQYPITKKKNFFWCVKKNSLLCRLISHSFSFVLYQFFFPPFFFFFFFCLIQGRIVYIMRIDLVFNFVCLFKFFFFFHFIFLGYLQLELKPFQYNFYIMRNKVFLTIPIKSKDYNIYQMVKKNRVRSPF